jgi:hypothetical protein
VSGRLLGLQTQNSRYQEVEFSNGDYDGSDALDSRDNDPDGDNLENVDNESMEKLIVRANNGSVAAEFQFTTDSIAGCHVAGFAAASS